ncbi:hypothetical protein NLX74_25145 [Paenibacillus sp. MZ03-122A]|nr:hypothetical protein [Paenibacillus sp. MZ03-122A]
MYERWEYERIYAFDHGTGDGTMHLLRKVVNPELFDTYIRERLTINRPDHQERTKQIRSPKGVWIKPRTFTKRTSAASCGTTATHYNLVCQAPDKHKFLFLYLLHRNFYKNSLKITNNA